MVKDGIYLSGRYQVLSKIGAGGMADVYKAKDCMLNRYVAVKVLKKEYREDENFVKKFRSEAQAAAGLLNPNIVNVYDVGEDRGLYYMVMELVEGITLKEYVHKKGKLSSKEAISIAIQMCTGIEAAQRLRILVLQRRQHRRQSAPVQWDRYTMYLRSRHGVAIVMRRVISILQVSPCMRW